MTLPTDLRSGPVPSLRRGVVLGVQEHQCEVFVGGEVVLVDYAPSFPSPRTERVAPGHLVALAGQDGGAVVVWRWYDAVVVGEQAGLVRVWEPAHGEVLARPRRDLPRPLGARAYLSAGLPGADWWLAGPVTFRPEDADVDLDEVARFCIEHDLWRPI